MLRAILLALLSLLPFSAWAATSAQPLTRVTWLSAPSSSLICGRTRAAIPLASTVSACPPTMAESINSTDRSGRYQIGRAFSTPYVAPSDDWSRFAAPRHDRPVGKSYRASTSRD